MASARSAFAARNAARGRARRGSRTLAPSVRVPERPSRPPSELRTFADGGVIEDGDPGALRHHLLEDLQLLGGQVLELDGAARDVAARPREARREARRDRIARDRRDNRDGAVACRAARTPGPPATTMTSTGALTRSVASAGSRSRLPSAHRYSMATFCPSTHPSSRSPCRNASSRRRARASGCRWRDSQSDTPSPPAAPRRRAARRAEPEPLGTRGGPSLDHLIRPLQERRRDREAEGLGGLEVDHELELRRLLHRQITGRVPLRIRST